MGLHALGALSDGTLIEAPLYIRAAEGKSADAQPALSLRVTLSDRGPKQARLVAGLPRRTAQQGHDFAHKLAQQLAKQYRLTLALRAAQRKGRR